jgi:hypothetical protein
MYKERASAKIVELAVPLFNMLLATACRDKKQGIGINKNIPLTNLLITVSNTCAVF